MAKFRTNHERTGSGSNSGMIVKIGIFAALLAGLYYAFSFFSNLNDNSFFPEEEEEKEIANPGFTSTIPPEMLPTSTTGQIVLHEYFALSYSEKDEQAEWVAYELTRDRLNNNIATRTNNYRIDPRISSKSADPNDYRRSGFDRGHLAPAGDMGFSNRSMSHSFYMSNISPQEHHFNGGIWRELEENVRDWARRFRHLYIVTGPVLTDEPLAVIGQNQITVPARFFKVILDVAEPELKGIAYLIPNEVCINPIDDYAVSINTIEEITGIDFFPDLLEDDLEEILEGQFDPSLWHYDRQRYQKRVREWNVR